MEDILAWIDHFENVADYHRWCNEEKPHKFKTLLEDIATTWLIQQATVIKHSWQNLRALMVQSFVHQNVKTNGLATFKVPKATTI